MQAGSSTSSSAAQQLGLQGSISTAISIPLGSFNSQKHMRACVRRGDGAVQGHPILATNINKDAPHAGMLAPLHLKTKLML